MRQRDSELSSLPGNEEALHSLTSVEFGESPDFYPHPAVKRWATLSPLGWCQRRLSPPQGGNEATLSTLGVSGGHMGNTHGVITHGDTHTHPYHWSPEG